MPGTLFLVATPIGNLEDMTFRAVRVLREVSLIAAEDTRRTGTLLTHYQIDTPTTSLHDHNEKSRVPMLVKRLQAGENLAVVTDAGMPSISDPGYLMVTAALEVGAMVEVVPGASALTTAIAGSGLPADLVAFRGFAPARAGERERFFREFRLAPGTSVFFETPHRLRESLKSLLENAGDRRIAVAHELTKLHESWHRGFVSQVIADERLPDKGEFTIVVGEEERKLDSRKPIDSLDPIQVASEFGELTKTTGLDRREALAELARRHQVPKRSVYAMIERAKKLAE
jgi:16S rRNA (cytidine1402-2'-O)-methyltransferase